MSRSDAPGATAAASPHAEYTRRLEAARHESTHWRKLEARVSRLRLVSFAAAALVGWLAFGSHVLSGWWIIPPLVAFVALLVWHDRIIQTRTRCDRRCSLYEDGLARLEDRWEGRNDGGERYLDTEHPYAIDLDIFGRGSLFEMVCSARTAAGERFVAAWLQAPSDAEVVRNRQEAVAELRDHVDLREELALLGEDVRSHMDPEAMMEWGEAEPVLSSTRLRALAALFTAATLGGLVCWLLLGSGPLPFIVALGVQGGFAWRLRARISPIIAGVARPTRDLSLVRGLLERLEVEEVESRRLAELRTALDTDGVPPSRRIAQLQRLVDLLDARSNQFFIPIGALLCWGTQLALAIEQWRASYGTALRPWIEASGEIEALCSLSGYAYEHPDHPFPQIVSPEEGPLFDAVALGHPLLPEATCIRNDLHLSADRQALIVSGSNMSGKSTLMRTAGTNAVLAFAGAPVDAKSLRLSPLQVAASIQIRDSLRQGISHFYAEIQRIHQVVSLADGERPVLFLLDEILHGTNSHDRRIGAAAVVRGLLERGAIGLVSTHDLALAKIAEELRPRMANVHFEDHLENGEMRFDYRLRDGVVRKSNAIELMRSVGLDV